MNQYDSRFILDYKHVILLFLVEKSVAENISK